MIELIKSVNNQLRKLAVRKNISWKDSESEQEFLKIINEELPKHQEWIKEGISMLENTKNDDANLALSKIVVGFRNIYLDFEAVDELLIKFSQEYSQR
ncbi:TPA: hypothetical protein U1V77_002005 [Streptococcus suis]|uniref:hypothetical protein n=1 Tax=Streptococcus suis TaxID=1307 RepID=UPI00209B89E8|nr:hypothetical protein [Streptococcus suis]MCO8200132.1 hypothetical protein [Streptococcus suis]MCO8217587.1 hypothetical protein [Streptococcus suis]HEM3468225.1 hypothetical protein [Streptococcus suis]HEM3478936.1 hypothetical protein [Streptococcus suis]HEM4031019.1 hypothetical protein [Streptococcus suis]